MQHRLPDLRPLRSEELVAVAIATKNRTGYLAALLTSLAQQTYPAWILVINDQSDKPVAEQPAVKDLLTLLRTLGKDVTVIRTTTAQDRYQRVLEAVPREIEFVHRIDDDVVLKSNYLEEVQKPFKYFPERPIAAVGGCLPGPHMEPMNLDKALRQPGWFPRIAKPTWRLQGHLYHDREIVEMESLWGCAMCYRRSAVEKVGGWIVAGQSPQIFREDSDMSARLVTAGYELLMTTAALGWHLVAPSGGAREVTKLADGSNIFNSHRDEYEADDTLFRRRLEKLLAAGYQRETFARYRISDLEQGQKIGRPLRSKRDQLYHWFMTNAPTPVRRMWQWAWRVFVRR